MVKKIFKTSSEIISEALGRNLTENISIVLAEQIKNAKDANANKVVLDFSNYKFSSKSKIIIIDNGEGTKEEDIDKT